jgi:hypothetical protein
MQNNSWIAREDRTSAMDVAVKICEHHTESLPSDDSGASQGNDLMSRSDLPVTGTGDSGPSCFRQQQPDDGPADLQQQEIACRRD